MVHVRDVSDVRNLEQALESTLLRRSTLEQDLPGALGGLDLLFQPVVALPGGQAVGVEALPSWRHPRQGVVHAAKLLPLAEDLGLLADIGRWTLHRSCRLLADWRLSTPRCGW